MLLLYAYLVPLLFWLFLLGAAVGSFLNVCIYRIPLGKSLSWPGSRCGHCFHEVRLKDNVPLLSYWLLRGRCRDCGAPFSMRYFWVELLTAATFVALYLLEILQNVQRLPVWPEGGLAFLEYMRTPPHSWALFVFHALLACFLITATACLLDRGRVPVPVAVTGTLVGLVGAALFPWPYPTDVALAVTGPAGSMARQPYFWVDSGPTGRPWRGPMPADASWADAPVSPRPGFYPWPVWGPLPDALAPGRWPLGLATGLAGALAGGWGLRLAGLVARRAVPAADLAMIAGAFLGWQPVLVAVALAGAVAIALSLWRRRPPLGLFLAGGVVAAWMGWAWVGPVVRPVLFSPLLLPAALIVTLALAVISLRGSVRAGSPKACEAASGAG
ncbi:MAG TPA: prepilin peptidase [Gemmataceae bacterium]|nr:prepilin peptidase [Gemmataceae bacterium]